MMIVLFHVADLIANPLKVFGGAHLWRHFLVTNTGDNGLRIDWPRKCLEDGARAEEYSVSRAIQSRGFHTRQRLPWIRF